jgi:hypothetical protein
MKKVLFFLLLALLISCTRTKTKEIKTKNPSWLIEIESWGAPWTPSFTVHFSSASDSMIVVEYKKVNDTVRNIMIPVINKRKALIISKSEKDSAYSYTRKIFKDFEFSTNDSGEVMDGTSISVELQQNNTKLECSFYKIDDIYKASEHVSKLVNLINSKLKKEDRIF